MAEMTDTDLALQLARALGWLREHESPLFPGTFIADPHDSRSWHQLHWLVDGDGMLLVLAAMQARGWDYALRSEQGGHQAEFSRAVDGVPHTAVGWAASPPCAVAKAALAGLETNSDG